MKHYFYFAGTAIEATVANSASCASDWVELMTAQYGARPIAVGLDAEWWHVSHYGRRNKVATLQLCIDDSCLILQLLHMDYIPYSIHRFLMNPNFTFVGVGVDEDVSKLRADYGLYCYDTMDVQAEAVARWPGLFMNRQPGLKKLAWELRGLRMEKPRRVTLSDWEEFRLSRDQVEYGCIDAFASFRIGEFLLSY